MSTSKSFSGRAVLCLILLTAGCLRSAVAGSLDQSNDQPSIAPAAIGASLYDGVASVALAR